MEQKAATPARAAKRRELKPLDRAKRMSWYLRPVIAGAKEAAEAVPAEIVRLERNEKAAESFLTV
ncbi:hypothetical protein [Planomicrobium sp. CPCC 101110]|uniref:hypothetical protein n=1 Tax=Planomicrobium sp. CPCC 101110 TaxID=2599619 RepID=UPI0011B658D6|nr:hypothetical protein [Planomicrobium sp. CPCC 101110]TWT27861.1 hypothetical protein FQV30_04970 [Planomicrobium sp. CPCC 101110]